MGYTCVYIKTIYIPLVLGILLIFYKSIFGGESTVISFYFYTGCLFPSKGIATSLRSSQ